MSQDVTALNGHLKLFRKNPPGGATVELVNGDVHDWRVSFPGPAGTVYEGGIFKIRVISTVQFPHKPPAVHFETHIYHMNVEQKNWQMCLDKLDEKKWTPAIKIGSVVADIVELLKNPDVTHAADASMGQQYQQNRALYDKTAREWTQKYAK